MLTNKKIKTGQCLTSRHEEKEKNKVTFNLDTNKVKEDGKEIKTQRIKKHIKFKRVNAQKSPASVKEKPQIKNLYYPKIQNSLKEDWSIFSPSFFKDNTDSTADGNNNQKNENNPPPPANHVLNTFKRTIDYSSSGPDLHMNSKTINVDCLQKNKYKRNLLIKEVNELKENNQKIFDLMIEKEKENKELNNEIDNYKANSLEQFSIYLDIAEELGQKNKILSSDFNNETKNFNNSKFKTEEEFELNKKIQLEKLLNKRNSEFEKINESIKKLIFNNDSILNNSEKPGIDGNMNIINDNEGNEIVQLKEEYNKLKNEYIELEKRFSKNKKDDNGTKNRIKFVYKDIPLTLKEKYETKIQRLIETNENSKKDYSKQLEEINITYGSMKVQYLNKQFENESKLMKMKKKIKNLIMQCDSSGITINIDRDI